MSKQDHEELMQLISTIIDERFATPKKTPLFDRIRIKLYEQGTQRGLMLLLPIVLVNWLHLDQQTALDIVTGILTIYGVHNVVTEG